MDFDNNDFSRKRSSLIPIKPWKKLLAYVFMIFTTGCIYWGWNGIQELLYKAGSFEEVCKNQPDSSLIEIGGKYYQDCGYRKSGINNLYTIAYSAHFITSIFTGFLVDYVGPRYCYMLGQFVNFGTWILVGLLPKSKWVLRICFFIFGMTAESLYMPLLSVSYNFPKKRSFVISIMGSSRSLSFFIPTLMSMVYQKEFFKPESLYIVCIGYAAVANIGCFITGMLIVDKRFDNREEEKLASNISNVDSLIDSGKNKINLMKRIKKVKTQIKKGVKHQQFSEYLRVVACAALFLTSIGFVNKSHREMLMTSNKDSAAHIFKYLNVMTFVPAPGFGKMIDIYGAGLVLLILHCCCFMYYFCASFDIYTLKVLACIFYFFAVSLCISSTYCYINQRFSRKYFGILVGFVFLIAGLTNLTNIGLYDLASKKWQKIYPYNFRRVAFIIMGYMLVCIVSSSSLYMLNRKKIILAKEEKNEIKKIII